MAVVGCQASPIANDTPCPGSPFGACSEGVCQNLTCPLGYRAIANPGDATQPKTCEAIEPAWGQRADQPSGVYSATTQAGGKVVVDSQTGLWWHGGADGPKATWLNAKSACDQLVYAGKSDWRLPSPLELSTLVGYVQAKDPFTDMAAFPQTQADMYWTSHDVPALAGCAFGLSFGTRGIGGKVKNDSLWFRSVRTHTLTKQVELRYLTTSEVVQDQWTGRMWQRAAAASSPVWAAAVSACDGLNLGGHSDWRLPSVRELLGIYRTDLTVVPAVVAAVFPSPRDAP